MESSSDALAPDELLSFLEQFSDASSPPPPPVDVHADDPLAWPPHEELRCDSELAVPSDDDGQQVQRIDVSALPERTCERTVLAQPVATVQEPMFSAEEREMLLFVLQDGPLDAVEGGGGTPVTRELELQEHRAKDGSAKSELGAEYTSSSSSSDSSAKGSPAASAGSTAAKRPHNGNTESDSSEGGSSQPQQLQQQKQPARKKKAPRPNRRRRKHEVDELRVQVKELVAKLLRLRAQGQVLLASGSHQDGGTLLIGEVGGQPTQPSVWQSIAVNEREASRTAMLENMRLRSLYESQLEVLQRLESMYRGQFDFAVRGDDILLLAMGVPQQFSSPLSKRLRSDPFDDDFAIFASLGRDFDAQYEGIDIILEAAGMLHFDGEMRAELRPKKDHQGKLFMESMHSRVIPQDMFVMDRAIHETNKDPRLRNLHKSFEVRHDSDMVSFMKVVDVIRLPHTEATLTVRMALRRFVFAHRVVGIWDGMIEVTGCVSMRLCEKGWNMLRPPHALPINHRGGPLTIEQSCVRYFPIDASISSEQDLAVGTVNRILVESYRRHLEFMHQITEDILTNDFDKLSLA